MKSGARPGAALSPARFVIPGVLGLLAVGYLCASLASPLFASLAVGLISVCVLLLISDRRGPWLAVEAWCSARPSTGCTTGSRSFNEN